MPTAVAPLARQVAARAQRDARFARVLDALLAAPTVPQGTLERIAAHKLNTQRRAVLVLAECGARGGGSVPDAILRMFPFGAGMGVEPQQRSPIIGHAAQGCFRRHRSSVPNE